MIIRDVLALPKSDSELLNLKQSRAEDVPK